MKGRNIVFTTKQLGTARNYISEYKKYKYLFLHSFSRSTSVRTCAPLQRLTKRVFGPRAPEKCSGRTRSRARGGRRLRSAHAGSWQQNLATFCKILAGLFSAVSKRKFASEYAFCSIFQHLQDLRAPDCKF